MSACEKKLRENSFQHTSSVKKNNFTETFFCIYQAIHGTSTFFHGCHNCLKKKPWVLMKNSFVTSKCPFFKINFLKIKLQLNLTSASAFLFSLAKNWVSCYQFVVAKNMRRSVRASTRWPDQHENSCQLLSIPFSWEKKDTKPNGKQLCQPLWSWNDKSIFFDSWWQQNKAHENHEKK